jgi:hypothetical protein
MKAFPLLKAAKLRLGTVRLLKIMGPFNAFVSSPRNLMSYYKSRVLEVSLLAWIKFFPKYRRLIHADIYPAGDQVWKGTILIQDDNPLFTTARVINYPPHIFADAGEKQFYCTRQFEHQVEKEFYRLIKGVKLRIS